MAHIHGVYDTDTHFSIDPLTRQLKYESEKLPGIVQYDHNSQVLTFEVPRHTLDGHDMSLCNKVRVHYINIDTITKEKRTGLYDVKDLQVAADDENVVLCSWPISRNATQMVGNLAFALRLACTENGEEVYGLSTVRYDKLTVSGGVHNDEAIVEEYADILDDWEARIQALEQGGATDEQIAAAVEAYMADHPVSGGNANGLSTTAANLLITILRNGVYSTDQSANITALETALASGGDEEEPDTPVVPDEPVVVTYTVTSGLTNVESTNASAVVNEGASYTATLTPAEGYELDSVIVTMGGVDITATAYADGVVTIPSVTGNVIITATAVKVSTGENNGWVDGEAYAIEWTDGYSLSNSTGELGEAANYSASGFIPCLGVSALVGTAPYDKYLYAYDANRTYLGRILVNKDYPFAINKEVAYVRFYVRTDSKATATLTPVVYEFLTENTTWENGVYYSVPYVARGGVNENTGVITQKDTDTWGMSDYAFCYGATSLTIVQDLVASSWRKRVVFFDAEKNYISGTIGKDSPYEVPENAMYFMVNGYDGFEYGLQKPNRPWVQLA